MPRHSDTNVFLGNDGGGDSVFTLSHGANSGDYWVGNVGASYRNIPGSATNVTSFDP